MGFRVRINFSDESSELVDEVFETESDAQHEYRLWLDSWNEGADVLDLAGECSYGKDIIDCDIWEE